MTYIDRLETLLTAMLIAAEQARLNQAETWSDTAKRNFILNWLRKRVRSRRFGIALSEVMLTYEKLLVNDRDGSSVIKLFDRIYQGIAHYRDLTATHPHTTRHDVTMALQAIEASGFHVMQGEWKDPEDSRELLFMPHADWQESFSHPPSPSQDFEPSKSARMIEDCGFYSCIPEPELVETFYQHGIVLMRGTEQANVRLSDKVVLCGYLMRNININDTSNLHYLLPNDLALMTKYVTLSER